MSSSSSRSLRSKGSVRDTSKRSLSNSADGSDLPVAEANAKKTKKTENHSNKKDKKSSSRKKTPQDNAENTSDTATNNNNNKKSNDNDDPWYTVFTKGDEQYNEYMKNEWGFEKRGDESMFEKLSLEGAQAGLSWLTILRKREAYRTTFHHFDIDKVAAMTSQDVQTILDTPKSVDTRNVVVKHRGKIEAVIHNAKCIQQMRQDAERNNKSNKKRTKMNSNDVFHGVFDEFLWSFVDDKPIVNNSWDGSNLSNAPSTSVESEAMSKALRKLGFKFVGPTTCYSMMQAYGMVIDHPVDSLEYDAAIERLQNRPGGYQMRQKK